MKRLYRLLCTLIAAVCVLGVAAVFVACGDKDDKPAPPKQYTITLNLNGEQVWDTFTGKKGDTIEFSKGEHPTRPNSNFKGWSTTPDGDIVELPTVMPEENRTYYAVFARYYNLTLRVGSGTLDGDAYVRAEVGQNLYSLVKDITPTAPGNSTFDGWYYGNKKIDAAATNVMPSTAITLDAKYSVDYTINIYKQNAYKSEAYTKVDSAVIKNTGFIGTSPRDSEYPAYVGFEFNEQKSGATSDFVLSATGDNVFNAYYNVQSYRLVFNPNPPAEGLSVSNSMGAAEWGYNEENAIPECQYAINGYRFDYWSTKADGSDRLDVGDTYKITDSSTLYAMWTRGYAELTGRSYDYIYLVNKNDTIVAYLDRYYLDEIEGVYDSDTDTVTFSDGDNEILRGKLDLNNYTFAYIKSQAYVLHALADMSDERISGYLDEAVTLTLLDNGTAVYSDEDGTVNGRYVFDKAVQSMKFTTENGDDTFYFRLSQFLDGSGVVDVFEIRSEAEVGVWCRLTDDNVEGSDYADASYLLELNGYGEAVMYATDFNDSTSYYSGYYRYSANCTDDKLEIYTVFITSYGSDINRLVLVDRSATAAATDQYKKFYKEYAYAVTAYAKPEDGASIDTETADRIVLDGYGLYNDSATFTVGGQTKTGKYMFNWVSRTLVLAPADGSADITYFVSTHAEGEGDDVSYYLVYEPIQSGKSELNKYYAISGLEKNFRPGNAYGFRFFNDNKAMLYVIMPDYNQLFNNVAWSLQPIVMGTYTPTDVSGEYLFTADISSEAVSVIKLYHTEVFGFKSGLDISGFGDFKFKFTSDAEGTGEVTALGDGFRNIELVDDDGFTYVTDGYGKATFTNNSGGTDVRDYVVMTDMGFYWIRLDWEEPYVDVNGNNKTRKMNKIYARIDGEFRAYIDEYGKHNTQYSAQIADTAFRMIVFEDDYAVLAYENYSTRQLVSYSIGKVTWTDSSKRFGFYDETWLMGSPTILSYLYGDFNFGLKEVTVTDSTGKETQATRFFTYDTPASEIVNGKYVVNGKDGATLTVDITKGEAEYSAPNPEGGRTTVAGEFKLREGVLSIVYTVQGEDEQTYVRSSAFKLGYDNDGNVISFAPTGSETGTWLDATGANGAMELYGDKTAKWHMYDSETESLVTIDGTYALTDNAETVEYEFSYTVTPDESVQDDNGKRSFKFTLAYNVARMPVYRIYSMPVGIMLYSSMTSSMPSYKLSGGGYSDLVLLSQSGSQTVGQLLIYPNFNLMMKDATLFAFSTDMRNPQPQMFFTIVGDEKNRRGVILDGTFGKDNLGMFEYDGTRELTLPVLKADGSGKYEDQKVVIDRIFFNGLGTAVLRRASDGASMPVMYLRYNTNTYALVTVSGDTDEEESINIIALLRLRTVTQEVPGENEDDEPTTETHYVVVFDDEELRATFKGEGHTAFVTDGFSSATYADELGGLHVCTFRRLDEHPEVLEVMYMNGLQLAYMYIVVDAGEGTFTELANDDQRIPTQDEEQVEDEEQDEQA